LGGKKEKTRRAKSVAAEMIEKQLEGEVEEEGFVIKVNWE